MAANKVEHGRVEGSVLRTERVAGAFRGQDGGEVAYDYTEVRVLTDEAEVSVLRIGSDNLGRPLHTVPNKGDVVAANVEFRAAGGNVRATVLSWVE